MLTDKCIKAYEEAGLEGELAKMMPDMDSVLLDDDTAYVSPNNDTESEILDRIERSKKAGRNLFLEEWEIWEPEPDCVY